MNENMRERKESDEQLKGKKIIRNVGKVTVLSCHKLKRASKEISAN